jgi:hypothetical protein
MKNKIVIMIAAVFMFINMTTANAICYDSNGNIAIIHGQVFSGDNFDGSCSDCNWNCARPISQW